MDKIIRVLSPILNNLSFRAGLYAIGAIAASLLAVFFASYVPDEFAELFGGNAVDRILTIMASSMLAVVTFSLATLVSSYSAATSIASPRATALIIEDSSAKSTLSVFLGAFIFSIVSLVALSTKYYGPKGRVILFIVTTGVLVLIIFAMIKWIGQLSQYSLLTNLIEKIEEKAKKTISKNHHNFDWSGRVTASSPMYPVRVTSTRAGFIRFIDLIELSNLAESLKLRIHIETTVGHYVLPGDLLLTVESEFGSEKEKTEVLNSFEFGAPRELENDPRFAFIVLSEIGSKALSPGINDPGTAVQILTSLTKLILTSKAECERKKSPECSQFLTFRKINPDEIFEDSYSAIARDGAHLVEVLSFLHRILRSFSNDPSLSEGAKRVASYSYELAKVKLVAPRDLARIRRICESETTEEETLEG